MNFRFVCSLSAGVDIYLYSGKSSAFQAERLQGRLCPQVVTCGYEGYCLSGKSEPVN